MNNHYIIEIKDIKNRLLEFERFKLKTSKGAYNSFLRFVKRYTLQNYERGFNSGLSSPSHIEIVKSDFENEVLIEKIPYTQFLEDLKSLV